MDMQKMMLVSAIDEPVGFTMPLKWVSRERDSQGQPRQERLPESHEERFQRTTGFTAAGKRYPGIRQLCAVPTEQEDVFLDLYGRKVLCVRELFPCFDSYDYLNEDRYFRWYYLCYDGKLTEVYCEDGLPRITVTEDVAKIRISWFSQVQQTWFMEE